MRASFSLLESKVDSQSPFLPLSVTAGSLLGPQVWKGDSFFNLVIKSPLTFHGSLSSVSESISNLCHYVSKARVTRKKRKRITIFRKGKG